MSDKSKMTPWPWTTKPVERHAETRIVGADGNLVCSIETLDPAEPDLCVIAAAPELLSALEQILGIYVEALLTGRTTTIPGSLIDAARAAVAKAKGG